MDLEALRHGNFASLGEAISDWSKVVKNLTTLKNDARDDLKGKADKADWAGLNATVSREFITKTAGEFADAVTQATTIRNILRDTRDELVEYRGELTRALDRGWEKRLTAVGTQGGGFKVFVNAHPEPANSKQAVDALRDELQGILTKATTSDTTAAQVLRAISKQAEHGFSDASYKDRDSAADALRHADDMARIAKKDPKDLTAEDFDKLNTGLKKYRDDPLFSEQFATRMGAKGTLEFWAGINSPHENPELVNNRHGKFDELQKSLGLTLASATQSDSPDMQRWEKSMVGLGSEYVPKDSGRVMGFQVMSNLMRWGDYDDKFLKGYGTELIKTEKDRSENGRRSAAETWNTVAGPLLNRTGTDSGNDPMTGFMKALANSPEASTDFFNDSFVTKNEDHDFLEDTDDKNTYEGKRSLSNFDYLFEERDWPKDVNDHGKTSNAGRESMAQALQAATTGHAPSTPPSLETSSHTREQADLFENIVKSVAEEPKHLTDHSFMSESFGKVTAEYMPDIQRGLHPGEIGEDRLFPVAGSAAKIGESDITRFLYSVGRDPDGYAAVNIGQHSYTTSLMEYHFKNPDAYIADPTYSQPDNLKQTIEDIARVSGEIEGTIGAGRSYQGEADGGAKDAEYNKAIESASTWGGSIVGTGIGMAVTPATGPGGVVIGGLASTAAGEIIGALTEGSMKDSSDETIYRNGEDMDGTRDSTYQLVERAAQKAGESADTPSPHIVSAAATAAEQGFNNAQTNISISIDGEGNPRKLEEEG